MYFPYWPLRKGREILGRLLVPQFGQIHPAIMERNVSSAITLS
jgi:hypothetical protein